MTPWYVDPDVIGGAGDGTSWVNAWTSLQTAADSVNTPGDIIYCRNSQILTASIDFDINSGGSGTPIQIIGMNANGIDDGTRFVLNGNSVAINCLRITKSHLVFKNIECKNATNTGVYFSTGNHCLFWNDYIHNNGNFGIDANSRAGILIYKSKVNNNSSHGITEVTQAIVALNEIIGNGGRAVSSVNGGCVFGNIGHDSSNDGTYAATTMVAYINNVWDGNAYDGMELASVLQCFLFGNRCTNNNYGITISGTGKGLEDYNFMVNNIAGQYNNTTGQISGGNSLTAGVEGYTDRANDNFNLTESATLRREPVEIGGITP